MNRFALYLVDQVGGETVVVGEWQFCYSEPAFETVPAMGGIARNSVRGEAMAEEFYPPEIQELPEIDISLEITETREKYVVIRGNRNVQI